MTLLAKMQRQCTHHTCSERATLVSNPLPYTVEDPFSHLRCYPPPSTGIYQWPAVLVQTEGLGDHLHPGSDPPGPQSVRVQIEGVSDPPVNCYTGTLHNSNKGFFGHTFIVNIF